MEVNLTFAALTPETRKGLLRALDHQQLNKMFMSLAASNPSMKDADKMRSKLANLHWESLKINLKIWI